MTVDRDESALESYRRSVAVFEGDCDDDRPAIADRKMFTIVAPAGGADSRITPAGFTVQWPHRAWPWSYFPSLAPDILSALREHAPGRSFAAPFELDENTLSRLGFSRSAPRWFWVTRAEDAIDIACRPAVGSASPPPEPPPLEPWKPKEKLVAYFLPLRTCSYCGQSPVSFRLLDEAVICSLCGRSERISEADLANAHVVATGVHARAPKLP